MQTASIFSVQSYTGTTIPDALLRQYGKLRYQCFEPDDPYLKMDQDQKIELDHFDGYPSTIYIMVTSKEHGKQTRLVSAVRLIPTIEPYDLEQPSWSYLTNSITLPKDQSIYEGSRWVGKSSRTYEGMLSTALLMLQISQLAQDLQFNQILGVVAAKGEAWINKRHAGNQKTGVRFPTKKDGEILITTLDVNQEFTHSAKTMMLQAMDFFSVSEIAVSAKAG